MPEAGRCPEVKRMAMNASGVVHSACVVHLSGSPCEAHILCPVNCIYLAACVLHESGTPPMHPPDAPPPRPTLKPPPDAVPLGAVIPPQPSPFAPRRRSCQAISPCAPVPLRHHAPFLYGCSGAAHAFWETGFQLLQRRGVSRQGALMRLQFSAALKKYCIACPSPAFSFQSHCTGKALFQDSHPGPQP